MYERLNRMNPSREWNTAPVLRVLEPLKLSTDLWIRSILRAYVYFPSSMEYRDCIVAQKQKRVLRPNIKINPPKFRGIIVGYRINPILVWTVKTNIITCNLF